MNIMDNKGNLTPYGKSAVFDLAVRETRGIPIIQDAIYGADPYLKYTNPNISMRYDDPNTTYYTNKNLFYNTNKPIDKQSSYVIESILRSPEAQRDAAYIMREFGSNLPVGTNTITPYNINEYSYGMQKGLAPMEYNELATTASRAEDLGLQGIIAPQRTGTEVFSNKPLTAIDIDNRVSAKNIGGAPELKPSYAVQDKIDEITEGFGKAYANLNKPLTFADKAMNFMVKHPYIAKAMNTLGKGAVVLDVGNKALGAYEGSRGIGANPATVITGIAYGPETAYLAKEGAQDITLQTPFNINNLDEYKASILTIPENEAKKKLAPPLYKWYQQNNGGMFKYYDFKNTTPLPKGFGSKYE